VRLHRRPGFQEIGEKTMRRLAIIAVLLPLAACAQYVWVKPGATQADFKRDAYNCEKDMRQSGYYGGGLAGALEAYGFEQRCMEAQGYTMQKAH
jgi:hypothetical protein